MKSNGIKILFGVSILILGAALFYKFISSEPQMSSSQKQESKWQTYSKISTDQVESYPSTEKEKKEMKIEDENHSKEDDRPDGRNIASQKPMERAWKGRGPSPLTTQIDNEVSEQWKERLGKELMRFMRPQTKSFIRREKSAIIKHKGKYLNVEMVSIKLKSPEGRHFGYNAYVNSETGKVIQTWNRTIHEDLSKNPLRLKATGALKAPQKENL